PRTYLSTFFPYTTLFRSPNQGFRNPYLGWTEESLDVYASLGFKYESNIAVLHDVVDLNAFSTLLQNGFAKSLKLFQAIPCSIYRSEEHTSELQSPDHLVC